MSVPNISPVCCFSVFSRHETPFGSDGEIFVLKHALSVTDEGRLEVGAGRNVRVGDVKRFFMRACDEAEGSVKWLHPGIIAHGSGMAVWRIPPQRRTLYYRVAGSIEKLEVPMPELVAMATSSGSLSVWAVRHFEERDTRLYHAPLMNFYASGSMCWGSVRPPKLDVSDLSAWESVIFDTVNTHVNHDRTLALKGKESVDSRAHLDFMRRIQSCNRFPKSKLAEAGLTLEQAVQRV